MPRRQTLLTLANAVTLIGLLLTLYGATRLNTVAGVIITGLGRMFDIADGKIARMTHTSSFFGAVFDATADKIGVLAIIIAGWHFGLAPKIILLAIFLQNLVNAIAFVIARVKMLKFKVASVTGKHAMFSENIALGCFALAGIIEQSVIHDTLYVAGIIAALLGVVVLGIPASYSYLASAITRKEHKTRPIL